MKIGIDVHGHPDAMGFDLAPDITEACLSDQQVGLTLDRLMRQGFAREWEAQRQLIRTTS